MSPILIIILSLVTLIFLHELGHFLAAKANGISVDAFSIGWGRKLVSYKYGETEYRISMLPFGGYCKMRGEELFKKALDEKAEQFPYQEGSLFSASPWRRIVTYAAGPGANFLFSILVMAVIWFSGFTITTFENKIVLLTDHPKLFEERTYPANQAGLQTGDRIIEANGSSVSSYADIQMLISQSADRRVELLIERNGEQKQIFIVPEMDRSTGAGRIGISAWIEPVVERTAPDSPGALAGLKENDTIIEIEGIPISHYLELYSYLMERPGRVTLTYLRNGSKEETVLVPGYDEHGTPDLGISFKPIRVATPSISPVEALQKGVTETFTTFILTLRGLRMLFSGVDVGQAVSGPIRITYFVGEVASSGFQEGIGAGFSAVFRFLSLLSVALCFGNLLPIPALDGGQIVLTVAELIKRSPVSPKTFYRYQTVGVVIIMMILFFTLFSDITYLFSR